jgi:hypothetical protein
MAVNPGSKIELADLLALGTLAQTKIGISGGYHFLGRTNTVDHAIEAPTC